MGNKSRARKQRRQSRQNLRTQQDPRPRPARDRRDVMSPREREGDTRREGQHHG